MPYYTAYEKRYAALYAQGVQYWTAHPEELRVLREAVEVFLEKCPLQTATTRHFIEFGCGEGYVGELLVSQGYRYTGIDLAASAIEKARERLKQFGDQVELLVADILDLSSLPSATFDAGIDMGCLHMLVVDADRYRYLQNANRVLKPGAQMLFREAYRSDVPAEIVENYEAWVKRTGVDVETPQVREAWQNGRGIEVHLPCFAARARNAEQYQQEMEEVGFEFLWSQISKDGLGMSFHVRKV
ncbi:MAG: class I SAM-dependent methyltransferase [Candidatus Latescibacteria bacterium]|nr:class I SAM-dependent methyltransferase [Candidatus Latescibacterota bacterium]